MNLRALAALTLAAALTSCATGPADPATPLTVAPITTTTAAATTRPAPVPNEPAVPAVLFDDGTYEVGTDIAPGKYKAPGGEGIDCYWSRNKDDSGELTGIIANSINAGPQSVTLKTGEFFTTQRCGRWTKR